jgi:carboxyl-terminal processing protease
MLKKTPFILLLILVTSGCSSLRLATNRHDVKMLRIAQQIRNNYVDAVDSQALTEAAIRAMLSQLDPYSQYLDAEETRASRDAMRRNFFGIGVQSIMLVDTLYVFGIVADSPAQKAGMMRGDRIIYINDSLVAGVEMSYEEVRQLLVGERGTTIDLRILRRDTPDLIDFRIAFDRVSVSSVDAAYMLTDDIGYIRLNRFATATAREFREARDMLQEQGMEHLILDLRNNGGGRLGVTTSITSEFLQRGQRITYLDGENTRRRRLNSLPRPRNEMLSGKVVVLVNEQTASASEILAGALQDWDRAVIVGRRTHGKALGQRQFSHAENTSLSLTAGRFYTPSGRSIQRPFESNDIEEHIESIRNRIYHAERFNVDSIQLYNVPRFNTLIYNRTVFGGGGILPDYFVVVDTTVATRLYNNLIRKDIIRSAAFLEIDGKRNELLYQYPDIEAFQDNFQLPASVFDRIKRLAEEKDVEWNDEQFEGAHSLIAVRLRAFIALYLYDLQAYHKIRNEENDIFQEGLRIISDTERYKNLLRGIGGNVGVRSAETEQSVGELIR